ncbi:hypothetical protein [Microcystis phage Mel-JY01]
MERFTTKKELESYLIGIGATEFDITDTLNVVAYFGDNIDNEWISNCRIPMDEFVLTHISNRYCDSEPRDLSEYVDGIMFQIEDGDFDGDIFDIDII